MRSIHVSWRRCNPPPFPPTQPEEMAATGTRDEGWPVVVITAAHESAITER